MGLCSERRWRWECVVRGSEMVMGVCSERIGDGDGTLQACVDGKIYIHIYIYTFK